MPAATPNPVTLVTSSSEPPFKDVTTPGGVLTNETVLSPPVGVLNVRVEQSVGGDRDVDDSVDARRWARRVERHEVLVGDVGRLEGRRRGERRVGELERLEAARRSGRRCALNDWSSAKSLKV